MSVPGAHLIGAFLKFEAQHVRLVVEGILMLPISTLLTICKDPVGGRVLIEGIFDAHEAFGFAKQRLADKLKGNFAMLALHKFGHHIVRKCYDSVSMKRKANVAKELADGSQRILGNSFGRSLHRYCKIELFKRHRSDWQASLTESAKRRDEWRTGWTMLGRASRGATKKPKKR